MKTSRPLFVLALSLAVGWVAPSRADDASAGIARQFVASEALPDLPGHALTAVTLELAPGKIAAPHSHDAFVFVYLLQGKVRSQLNGGVPVDYAAGEAWVEPPGAVHSLTQNLSKNQAARLLVVFVAENGARLTTSGAIQR